MKSLKIMALVLLQALAFGKSVDLKSQDISWVGDKVIGDGHSGIVKIKKGSLDISKGLLKKTTITVDMNTIKTTDMTGEWALKLDGHLKNDDFFAVNKFPESKLVISKDVKLKEGTNKIKAKLFIKDKSGDITLIVNKKKSNLVVNFEFDRTKYGVKYSSPNFFKGLGDKAIKDIVKMSFKTKL
jgi:polyisoprenoid-binding protein YceI